ncbi:MAG TPA: hypothetical protein VF185_01870 [Patescibacteria group bacterium]
MITDRTGSHLDQVSFLILQEQEQLKRQETAETFVSNAKKIMLDYGPTEYVQIDHKQKYRELPCGVAATPEMEFTSPDGRSVLINLVARVVGKVYDKYGRISTIGINFKDKEGSSQFTVSLDSNGMIVPATLPSLNDAQNGLLILKQIESDYRRRNLEIHPVPEDWEHR